MIRFASFSEMTIMENKSVEICWFLKSHLPDSSWFQATKLKARTDLF